MRRLYWQRWLLKDPAPDPDLEEIREVCRRLDAANRRFSLESDPDLIEACIFEQESLRARYRYLLRKAREERLTAPLSGTEDTDTRLSG